MLSRRLRAIASQQYRRAPSGDSLAERCNWLDRRSSWLYVDPQQEVRGRVDQIRAGDGAWWYWWQTAGASGYGLNLAQAMSSVERALEQR